MTDAVPLEPRRATLDKTAVGAAAAAAAIVSYGAYGDPHADSSQKSAVPILIGVAVVITAIVFGLLVPRALRAVESGTPSAVCWSLGTQLPPTIPAPPNAS